MSNHSINCKQGPYLFPLFLTVAFFSVALFNDFPLIPGSHLFRSPTSFFVPILILLLIIHANEKIYFGQSQKFAMFFLLSLLVSSAINFPASMKLHSIEVDGYVVIFKATLSYMFVLTSFFLVANVINSPRRLASCIDGIALGCIVTVIVGVIEYCAYGLSQSWAIFLNNIIESLIHDRPHTIGDLRVRAMAFEPSYLGLYLAFAFPFIVWVSLIRRKVRYWLLLVAVLAIILLSHSRTALLSILIEVILFSFFMQRIRITRRFSAMKIIFIFTVFSFLLYGGYKAALTVYSLKKNDISNVTRISSQVAAIKLFADYPVFGVGPGLAGAYLPDYYPDFAWRSYQAKKWADMRDTSLSTPVFAMFPRMLAETGIVGTGTFLLLAASLLIRLRKRFYHSGLSYDNKLLHLAVFVSIVGQLAASFGVDTIVFYGYWFSFGLASALLSNKALTGYVAASLSKHHIPPAVVRSYK